MINNQHLNGSGSPDKKRNMSKDTATALIGLNGLDTFSAVVDDCEKHCLTGVLVGAPGSGKSYLLNSVCEQRRARGKRAVTYAPTGFENSPRVSRALKRYLPRAIRNIHTGRCGFDRLLVAVSEDVLVDGVSLVMIDDADIVPGLVLSQLFRILKTARQVRRPFGLVLAGQTHPKFWMPGFSGDEEPSGQLLMGDLIGAGNWMNHTLSTVTSIRKIVHLQPLEAGACLDVICAWSNGFDALRDRVNLDPEGKKDRKAFATAELLARVTLGNVGILRLFAILKNEHFPAEEATADLIELIREELVAPVTFERMQRK